MPQAAEACVATFSKPPKGAAETRIVIEAKLHDGAWEFRIQRFTQRQARTDAASAPVRSIEEVVESMLSQGWGQTLIQTPIGDVLILQTLKNGQLRRTVKAQKATRSDWDHLLADRPKARVLDPHSDVRLLHALDITSVDGVMLHGMGDKFRQINRLLDTILHDLGDLRSVRIVDLGCGKAYLSLSLYYALHRNGVDVTLTGVDSNLHVIEHCSQVARSLSMSGAHFICMSIADVPAAPADVVLALHACDTATDDAIACAIRCEARNIYVAPCCHHFVQKQLHRDRVPEWARPLLDDGITRERLGDLLTDTMRRDLLRSVGYNAHLEEFVSIDHTPKNVLLRAIRTVIPTHDRIRFAESVRSMQLAWGVAPRLVDDVKPTVLNTGQSAGT